MVPPPKLVHAVEFHNATPGEVTVRVAYDDHKDKVEIQDEQAVAAGASHVFAAKELDMGGWQAVAPIVRVTVSGGGHDSVLQPSVGGIVKLLKVTASGGGASGALHLAQAH